MGGSRRGGEGRYGALCPEGVAVGPVMARLLFLRPDIRSVFQEAAVMVFSPAALQAVGIRHRSCELRRHLRRPSPVAVATVFHATVLHAQPHREMVHVRSEKAAEMLPQRHHMSPRSPLLPSPLLSTSGRCGTQCRAAPMPAGAAACTGRQEAVSGAPATFFRRSSSI